MEAGVFAERVIDAVGYMQEEFLRLSDPLAAAAMAAYMKTDMAFYGVKKPARQPVYRHIKPLVTPADATEYEHVVRVFWELPHREEKYFAMSLASDFKAFITPAAIPLYGSLIVDGAWWDFVDHVAVNCVGPTLLDERPVVKPIMEQWVYDDNMWLRRTALLAHLKHKSATDQDTLFEHCLMLATEKEFFIRKAIGWVLREYAKTRPDEVARFVVQNRKRWSGLTFREATKHLDLQ